MRPGPPLRGTLQALRALVTQASRVSGFDKAMAEDVLLLVAGVAV